MPHERELLALAEAVARGDESELRSAREAALTALGAEAFVEACAVAANFERMVRIADGTGIALDGAFDTLSASYRSDLGIDRYGSAASTPPTPWLRRIAGRVLAPVAPYALRWMAQHLKRRHSTDVFARPR